MEPQFIVNMNGNTADDIKTDYERAMRAADALNAALTEVYANAANGRNYQTCEDETAFKADRDVLIGMRRTTEQIREFCLAGAARAIRQREGL